MIQLKNNRIRFLRLVSILFLVPVTVYAMTEGDAAKMTIFETLVVMISVSTLQVETLALAYSMS
jgi:putative effector of murein hydrolase LrgA (UPF0299 family)